MIKIPRAIQELTNQFELLPGIGPKTAQRLTFYLLHVPQSLLEEFSAALVNLKKNTVQCSICQNIAEENPCPVCSDPSRDSTTIMVVEHPLDVMVIERTNTYNGHYHVLHGTISPLDDIGPSELFIKELVSRVKENSGLKEIILGLNPTMEGEATALYLKNQIVRLTISGLRLTRLGQGMPTGGDLQYADESTLKQALEGRKKY